MATLDHPTLPATSSDTKQLPLDSPPLQPEAHVQAQAVQPDAIKAAHAYFSGQAGGSAEWILPNLALTTPGAPGADSGAVSGPNVTEPTGEHPAAPGSHAPSGSHDRPLIIGPIGKYPTSPSAPGADQGDVYGPNATMPVGKHTFQPEAPGADGSPKRPDITEPTGKHTAPPEAPGADGSPKRPDVTEPVGHYQAPPEGPGAGGSQERPIAINADPEKLKTIKGDSAASTGGGSMDSDKLAGTIDTKTIPAYHQVGGSLGAY